MNMQRPTFADSKIWFHRQADERTVSDVRGRVSDPWRTGEEDVVQR